MTIDKDLVMKRFNKNIVTWDRFAEEAKGHEKDVVIIKLPEPIKREYAKPGSDEVINVEFPCITFVKLPNSKEASILVRFNENNHPVFNIPEEIMKMFVEEQEEKE